MQICGSIGLIKEERRASLTVFVMSETKENKQCIIPRFLLKSTYRFWWTIWTWTQFLALTLEPLHLYHENLRKIHTFTFFFSKPVISCLHRYIYIGIWTRVLQKTESRNSSGCYHMISIFVKRHFGAFRSCLTYSSF